MEPRFPHGNKGRVLGGRGREAMFGEGIVPRVHLLLSKPLLLLALCNLDSVSPSENGNNNPSSPPPPLSHGMWEDSRVRQVNFSTQEALAIVPMSLPLVLSEVS